MAERSPQQRVEKHAHDTDDEDDSPDTVRTHFTNVTAAIDKLREVCSNVGFVARTHLKLLTRSHAHGSFLYDTHSPTKCFVVRMALDTSSFFEEYTASQLGIERTRQIIVQVEFTPEFLVKRAPPTFTLFMSHDCNLSVQQLDDIEVDFGIVEWFIHTRLTKCLDDCWKAFPDKAVADLIPLTRPSMQPGKKTRDLQQLLRTVSQQAREEASQREDVVAEIDPMDANINAIVGMGFTLSQAKAALTLTGNDVDQALDAIVTGKVMDDRGGESADTPYVQSCMYMCWYTVCVTCFI